MIGGGSDSSSGGRRLNVWVIAGLIILVLVGIGLVVGGILLDRGGQPEAEVTQLPTATLIPVMPTAAAPTDTPLPTATLLPEATVPPATDVPPEATTPSAMIEAGEGGVNVRGGPGTNFSAIGRLEPGEKAAVTGKYADWWQIDYSGAEGWVANWVVTASGTDAVAEVAPPASPIPPTAAPAPTEAPPPPPPAPADCRGIVPDKFEVEGAPGPYSAGASIWFNLWITNQAASAVEYKSLGVVALQGETTVHYQQSYSYSDVGGYQQFNHRDRIILESPGTYDLWLTIGFQDEYWCRLMGPIQVVVQ